ncbi:unnamed protein product [Caenorhabditis sp. 36 PRJEB53466]|nr:unnamed protein product [Caenorhabditis sp. 36 PRJEB53466]
MDSLFDDDVLDPLPVFFKLQTKDGKVLEMSLPALRLSTTLGDLLDCRAHDTPMDVPIQVQCVKWPMLSLIAQWCEHHKDEVTFKLTYEMSEWDRDFLDLDDGELFDLINCSYYLDIQGLMHIGCIQLCRMSEEEAKERRTYSLVDAKAVIELIKANELKYADMTGAV